MLILLGIAMILLGAWLVLSTMHKDEPGVFDGPLALIGAMMVIYGPFLVLTHG
jgi:hypothetical protein